MRVSVVRIELIAGRINFTRKVYELRKKRNRNF